MSENKLNGLKSYVLNMTEYTKNFSKEIPDVMNIDFFDGYYTGYHKALIEVMDCIERIFEDDIRSLDKV